MVVGYPVGDPPGDVEDGPALLKLVRGDVCALGDLIGGGVGSEVGTVLVGVDGIGWGDWGPVRGLRCGGEVGDCVTGLGGADGGDVAFGGGGLVTAPGRGGLAAYNGAADVRS